MKCPRQTAFAKKLDELLSIQRDACLQHFSFDEKEKIVDELQEKRKLFINNWCPTFIEYEEF
jgi:hypothetical protein